MTRDYRIYDEWDNEEFLTGATVDLIEDGRVVHTEKFVVSSEEPGLESSFYNGQGNHATTQALSYANAWVEAHDYHERVPGQVFGSDDLYEMDRASYEIGVAAEESFQ